jgi:hypothetical protein
VAESTNAAGRMKLDRLMSLTIFHCNTGCSYLRSHVFLVDRVGNRHWLMIELAAASEASSIMLG